MATDTHLVQGEVSEENNAGEMDVEKLLIGFLRSLLAEQRGEGSGS